MIARRLSCRICRTYARASQGSLRGSFVVGRPNWHTQNQCGKAKLPQIKSYAGSLESRSQYCTETYF